MIKLPRREFLRIATGAVVLPAMSRIARAQTYPSRTVTMIVPFAAGGPTDVSARIVAEHMSRTLGQQIIFDFFEKSEPPSSQDLEKAWRPYIETCIAAFGPQRSMFESNFPVDKGTCS